MRGLPVALRKVRSLTTFSLFEIALIVPVFLALGCARLAIAILPFRTYARRMGRQSPLDTRAPSLSAAQLKRAKSIGRVVRSTANITPWASLCLAQAMVAAALLGVANIPYCVFFGLSSTSDPHAPDPLAAHSWVRAAETNLTGGQKVGMYTVVMVFERSPKGAR